GEVDVHVAEDLRIAGRPGGAQRPAAALGLQVQDDGVRQLEGQAAGDRQGRVGAGVVGDHDPPGVGQVRGQKVVQAADRALEPGLLVVDRDDDVDPREG